MMQELSHECDLTIAPDEFKHQRLIKLQINKSRASPLRIVQRLMQTPKQTNERKIKKLLCKHEFFYYHLQ